MTGRLTRLLRNQTGAAAAEMALVAPLLVLIALSTVEVGNFFLDQHKLAKSVRDGARFAARQSFTNYTSCSGSPGGTVVDDTRNVVKYGYRTGSSVLTPNITDADITVTTQCYPGAVGGQTMSGLYTGRANGAQIVIVTASVPYVPLVAPYRFNNAGLLLNATSQAPVSGI